MTLQGSRAPHSQCDTFHVLRTARTPQSPPVSILTSMAAAYLPFVNSAFPSAFSSSAALRSAAVVVMIGVRGAAGAPVDCDADAAALGWLDAKDCAGAAPLSTRPGAPPVGPADDPACPVPACCVAAGREAGSRANLSACACAEAAVGCPAAAAGVAGGLCELDEAPPHAFPIHGVARGLNLPCACCLARAFQSSFRRNVHTVLCMNVVYQIYQ